jgi:hypothetical protein
MALLGKMYYIPRCISWARASVPLFTEFISFVCVMLSLGLFLSFSEAQTNKREREM